MRNTYSKLNYHLVFSTKNRIPLIAETVRDELYGYIGGILRGNGGVLWLPEACRTMSIFWRDGDQHLGRQDAPA